MNSMFETKSKKLRQRNGTALRSLKKRYLEPWAGGFILGMRERDLRLRGRSTEECFSAPATRQDLLFTTINLLQRSRGVGPRTRLAAIRPPRTRTRWERFRDDIRRVKRRWNMEMHLGLRSDFRRLWFCLLIRIEAKTRAFLGGLPRELLIPLSCPE